MYGRKTFEAIGVKAGPDDGLAEGHVSALISVYGNKDQHGDVLERASYEEWVADVKEGRARMPALVFHHDHQNPFAYVGDAVDLDLDGEATLEDGTVVKGLRAEVQFDVNQPDNPQAEAYAQKAFDNVRTGRMAEWSMAWRAKTADRTKAGRVLKGVSLPEISPVLAGANRLTRTLAVKSDPDAAGRKAYVEIDVPGSYEEIQDQLRDALQAKYGSADGQIGGPWVTLVATLPDRACYQVCDSSDSEQDDALYWVDYAIADDGTVTLGEPTAASATISGAASATAQTTSSQKGELLRLAAEAVSI